MLEFIHNPGVFSAFRRSGSATRNLPFQGKVVSGPLSAKALVAAALTATLFGCTKASGEDAIALKEGSVRVAFSASVPAPETKATAVLSLESFTVDATQGAAGSETSAWDGAVFSLENGLFVSNRFWPEDMDPVYHFYASNAAMTFDEAGTTVDADNATDVVCAYLSSSTYKATNALVFEHVFARLGAVTVTAALGYTVTGVSITITPKTGGTYNMRTGYGSTDGTGWSSLDTGSGTELANATPGVKANDIYLVPGLYAVTCEWTATEDDYTEDFVKEVGVSLVAGKVNTISATLGGRLSVIDFGVSLADWDDADVDAGTFPID